MDKSSLFDNTLVDEDLLSLSQTESDLFASQVNDQVTLDSDEKDLVELLHELQASASAFPKDASEAEHKNKTDISSPSDNSDDRSLVLSQLSRLSQERYEQEVADTLEMSQVVWNEDPFQDGSGAEGSDKRTESQQVANEKEEEKFDDDPFWDNYDFDSVLDYPS